MKTIKNKTYIMQLISTAIHIRVLLSIRQLKRCFFADRQIKYSTELPLIRVTTTKATKKLLLQTFESIWPRHVLA